VKWLVAILLVAGGARAEPLALRADVFASTAAPAGLLTLAADGDLGPNFSAEAVVWTGQTGATAGDRSDGDVLVIALHAHTRDGRISGTLGRFVATLGALRPVQIDGVRTRVRLPHAIDVEAYAGIPVMPGLSRSWDWVTGGRIARRIGDWGSVGAGYMQQRTGGELALEEVGIDAGAALGTHDDLAGKLAYDVANPGLAEATITASDRRGAWRRDVYATYIAASHILPATSLFTVLGDVPAVRVGTTWTWRAAPRLDVVADLAVRRSDGDAIDGPATSPSRPAEVGEVIAPAVAVHATLRLDDRGASAVAGELRRDGGGDAAWTGARASIRFPLPGSLVASSELELVVPDRDRDLGRVWPWALAALSRTAGAWHAAIAVEAQASPEDRARIDVLAQLERAWGKP
jgi:hypothetical protein